MSFSAEMKDFLTAYKVGQGINASRTDQEYKSAQTEATTKKTERENDPETLELARKQAQATLDRTTDALKTSAVSRSALQARTGDQLENSKTIRALRQEQLRQLQNPQATGGIGLAADGYAPGAAPGAAGALPIGPSTMQTDTDMYADGGLVPEEEDEDPAGALDIAEEPVAAPALAPTDVSAQSRQTRPPKGLEGVISPALVADATKAGMKFGVNSYGLGRGGVRTPEAQAKARLFAQGHDGLSNEEMQAARQAVDPEGKLSESQRNMAALGSVYQFYANKGEGRKAEKVAFQMLQHYRNASQRYAAIAAKAAEGGNMDLAMKAAVKAYANVPDGNDLEVLPNPDGGLMYAVTGPNGDVVVKGIATPQQLAASAMGLATGGFDKAILSAAGARENTGAVNTKGSGRPQSASDRAKEEETAQAAVEKMKTKWSADEKNKGKPVDEEYWEQAGNLATHIMQQNKVTSSEAARAAELLISPGKKDPEKPDFKVTPGEEGKPSKLRFNNGLSIELDDNQLDQVMNARAARVKAAVDKINTDMEESDKPSKFAEGAKIAGGAIARDAEKFAGEVKGAIPDELIARGGSAIRSVGRAAGDVAEKLTDPNMNFGTMATGFKDGVRAGAQMAIDAVRNKGALPVDDGDRPL